MKAMKADKTRRKLNKRLVRQTLRGYARADKFTLSEELAWAAQLTREQARMLFIELCQVWEHGGERAGGNRQAIERLRIAETIRSQRPFAEIARRMQRQ